MSERYVQYSLPLDVPGKDGDLLEPSKVISSSDNSIDPQDRAIHEWYRFVLSFPPHLVRDYISDFGLGEGSVVLDPFCGTGTTLVESKLHGICAIGLESNPFPHFASTVKTDWNIASDVLRTFAEQISRNACAELATQGIDDQPFLSQPRGKLRTLSEQAMRALIKNSISPLPLHKRSLRHT